MLSAGRGRVRTGRACYRVAKKNGTQVVDALKLIPRRHERLLLRLSVS